MDRKNTIWNGLLFTLVIIVLASVSIAGVSLVSGENPESRPYYISESGDPDDIFSFETTQGISNIEIRTGEKEANSKYLIFYLSFAELEKTDFNVSKAELSRSDVSNGNVTDSNLIVDEQRRILAIQIEQVNSSKPVQIESIQLDGLDPVSAKTSEEIQYEMGVVDQDSEKTYSDLKEKNLTKNSNEFEYLNGSITILDQATVSTNFARDGRTSSGVTISKIKSNINSTVVLTDKENGEIVGYQSLTAQDMDVDHMISLNTSNLGGEYGAYLIPDQKIKIDQNDIGTELSIESKQSAIGRSDFHVYLGTVQFENQEYSPEEATEVTVAKAELRDTVGMQTPYIVSLHPLTSNGEIAYEKYVGYSDVLVGVHDELSISIRDSDGNTSNLKRSNRYIATIRLAEGQTPGDPVDINSTRPLLNSDITDQFVDGDVSDSAEIHISNVPVDGNSSYTFDHQYNESEYDGEQLYSGGLVSFEYNSTSGESVELHRNRPDRAPVVTGVGLHLKDENKVAFNTTGLETGIYTLSGGNINGDGEFSIVGKSDQNASLGEIDNEITIGEYPEYQLHHNVSGVEIKIIASSTSQIYATANLSTPKPGRTEIGINTYALGNESLTGNVVTAGSNATVESVDTSLPNGTLPPGTYRVAVRSEQGLAETADEATVTVENRSTNGMRVYATTNIDPDSLETAQTVRQAIADGTLSPTETVGPDETVVYAVNATGLTGLPAARNATIETGDDLARFDGFAFDVQSSTATDDTETEANGSVPDNSSVHLDEGGLFLVSDGSDALATDETPTDGETVTAEFRVVDEQLREGASASATGHEVSATVTFETSESSGDDGEMTDGSGSLDESGGGVGDSGGSLDESGGSGGSGGGTDGMDQSTGGTSGATTGSGTSTGPAADGVRDSSDDRDRVGFGRASGRFEIRPAADIRTVAGRESVASPTVVSVSTPPTRTGGDHLGGDTGPSGENYPSGDARTAEQAADGDQSSPTESAADASQTTDRSDKSTTPKDTTTVEPPTPNYDDAPIRATAEDVPGFGPLVTVLALVLAGRLGARRRDT